jgi:L-ribulose-5-phosphate 3-epimerase
MAQERISIVTDEIAQDLDTVSQFLREHDMRMVEIRTVGGKRIPDIDRRIWEDVKKRCMQEGWRILALSPGTFKGHHSDRERARRELNETLPETMSRANEVKAKYIITFGFMGEADEAPPGHVAEYLREAAELCREGGVALLLENEPGSYADTGERTRRLLDMVNHPNIFANWDPCNSNIFDDPGKLAESARALGSFIKHVHVKDGAPVAGSLFARYGPISSGRLGWGEHLRALKDMGYRGWFGVETHYEPLYESSSVLLSEFRSLLEEIDFWGDAK